MHDGRGRPGLPRSGSWPPAATAATALIGALLACALLATPAAGQEAPYRTPRAGEGFETEVFGERIVVPRRDRGRTLALTLGAAAFDPPLVAGAVTPVFNVYWLRYWQSRRIYALFSGVFNRVEYGEHLWSSPGYPHGPLLEAVAAAENFTVPAPLLESRASGRAARGSEVWWGRTSLDLGLGVRRGVFPFGFDNDGRIQLLARAEWDYFRRHEDTAPGAIVPDTTAALGGRLLLRLDGLERNLLELPHRGIAFGGAVDLLRRLDWREPGVRGPDGARLSAAGSANVLRASGYAFAALGVPGLSERHRLVAQVHAGWSPPGWVDRFSAFRLGAGPYQSEAFDLRRIAYPGAAFEQLAAQSYAIGGLTYRYELTFFTYLHARVLAAWGRIGEWDPTGWRLRFEPRSGLAYSAGVTTGFLWESQILIEYTFDTGLARDGREGHSVLLLWSKAL